jgi:AcrR family transcriptional regulator
MLRDALAEEIHVTGDLSSVTVTAVTERAGVTRRTFYSHYRDIDDLVSSIEDATLEDISALVETVMESHLEQVFDSIDRLEPVPGATELLSYFKDNQRLIEALMCPGGDPRFSQRFKDAAHEIAASRALEGIDERALGAFFDYYITFLVGALFGVIQRWVLNGMKESVDAMAHLMTLLMFVRPGDLYGNQHDINVAGYGLAIMLAMEDESHDE